MDPVVAREAREEEEEEARSNLLPRARRGHQRIDGKSADEIIHRHQSSVDDCSFTISKLFVLFVPLWMRER